MDGATVGEHDLVRGSRPRDQPPALERDTLGEGFTGRVEADEGAVDRTRRGLEAPGAFDDTWLEAGVENEPHRSVLIVLEVGRQPQVIEDLEVMAGGVDGGDQPMVDRGRRGRGGRGGEHRDGEGETESHGHLRGGFYASAAAGRAPAASGESRDEIEPWEPTGGPGAFPDPDRHNEGASPPQDL